MEDAGEQPRAGYRQDVQGLRALAIVLVVLCHAGLAVPGGFIGVDVFFVVSGYVIGAKLLRERERDGSLGIGAFYAGRARRLLPSLALVLVVGIVLTLVLIDPHQYQAIPLKTAAAASVFAANGYLYRHLGYFDASADATNPFLHLWSLSVEEQFYLVLPVLLLVAWRLGRRGAVVAVAALGAASFLLGLALVHGSVTALDAPVRAAFYLSPPRFWELACGVVLALVPGAVAGLGPRLASVLAALGLALVVGAALVLDPLSTFPGAPATVPVAGAVLLLATGDRSPVASRVLGWGPLGWVGDRSYGWYLWHWPAIVFAAILWPGSRPAAVAAAIGSLGIAALVRLAFEERVRRDRRLVGGRAVALGVACAGIPALLALGALAASDGGLGVREPADWYAFPPGHGIGCALINRDLDQTWPQDDCTFEPPGGAATGTVLVLGDLHADSVAGAAITAAAPRHLRVVESARDGCPFGATVPRGYPRCDEFQRAAWSRIERLRPEVVVIANRSTALGGDDPARWGRDLERTLRRLRAQGIRPIVVGPVPEYRKGFPQPSVLRPSLDAPVRRRADVVRERRAVVAAEREAVRRAGGRYVDPLPDVCGPRTCSPESGGRWRYYDPYHLNEPGAALLVPALGRALDLSR